MANEARYPRDMSFIDKEGNLVRPIDRQGNIILPNKEGYLASKSGILKRLSKKLKVSNSWQRKKILSGVYKQLVVSNTGKTAKGEYRDFVEIRDNVAQYLAKCVSEALEENGLENHSNRLKKEYGIKGKAYAFFDCNVSLNEIQESMPEIREYASSPSELELSLQEGIPVMKMEPGLRSLVSQHCGDFRILPSGVGVDDIESIPIAALRCSMVAEYPGQSNKRTAGELGDVLNQVYNLDRHVNRDTAIFRGVILYKEKGRYLFRE